MSRQKVLALVLAGGEGGRLDVLTHERAKPAMPFGGAYRLIDFALSNCANSHLRDVWVIEQYEPHGLNDHLANGRPWDLDRLVGGLQVLSPFVAKQGGAGGGFAEGNADALFRSRHLIRAFAPDQVLVLSADHVYTLDFRDVLDRHHETGADVTVVTTPVPDGDDASRFGLVRVDGDGRISDFAYKPDTPFSDTVTAEVFVYTTQVLLDTLDELAGERGDGAKNNRDEDGKDTAVLKDFGHELLPRLVTRGNAFAFALPGYWRDVGTIESYWQAHQDLLNEPGLALDDPAWPLRTYAGARLPARVYASAHLDNSLVAPGCVIKGKVVRSVLSPGVVVEESATVSDSVLLQDTLVEAGATVNRAIIDENVRVGRGARVGEENANGGIAVIGRRARVPASAMIAPGDRVPPAGKAP